MTVLVRFDVTLPLPAGALQGVQPPSNIFFLKSEGQEEKKKNRGWGCRIFTFFIVRTFI